VAAVAVPVLVALTFAKRRPSSRPRPELSPWPGHCSRR